MRTFWGDFDSLMEIFENKFGNKEHFIIYYFLIKPHFNGRKQEDSVMKYHGIIEIRLHVLYVNLKKNCCL